MSLVPTNQYILVGDRQVPLPEGVSVADWALEKVRWQNPRLRAFLGCIRQLEQVLDSNFAILHCSPDRLHDIQRRVCQTSDTIRGELAELLAARSRIPALEDALRGARFALAGLTEGLLAEIDELPERIAAGDLLPARKLLCVSIGQLHGFLQDTFGNLLAADPRSLYDADYFLSRRFPRDIEEAEWLYATVDRLQSYLKSLGRPVLSLLRDEARRIRHEKTLPHGEAWSQIEPLLRSLTEDLTPLLRQILALRGIRFDEMEMLDRYASEIPSCCTLVLTLYQSGHEITGEIMAESGAPARPTPHRVRDLTASHEVLGRRMSALLGELERTLHDLMAFVPLWLKNIEMRRALMLLRKTPEDHQLPSAG